MKKHLIIFAILFFLTPLFAMAEDISVSASLRKSGLSVGESTVFIVAVNGTTSASPPSVPQVDFARIQYVGPSTQVSIVNNQSTAKINFQYYLTPLKEGSFALPSITVEVAGETYTTEPLEIKVYKAGGAGAHADNDEIESSENDVLIEMGLDADEVYVDQQVLLSLKVYRREPAENISSVRHNLPELDDFIAESTAEKKQEFVSKEGFNYLKTEYKWILFPTREGEYTFPPVEAAYYRLVKQTASSGRRSLFDDDFFSSPFDDEFMSPFFNRNYKRIPMRVFSKPLSLRVLPLPSESRPEKFSGTVGSYEMDVSVSPEEGYQVGSPINMTVTISGVGHISSIAEPEFTGEEDFRIFPPETTYETEKLENVQRGKKIFKKVLIPKEQGEYDLPGVSFTYYDPILKSYQKLEKEGKKISVKRGEQAAMILPSSQENYPRSKTGEKIDYKGYDIITVKDSMGDSSLMKGAHFRIPLIILFLYPAIVILGETVFFSMEKRRSNPLVLRNRKAYGTFRKNVKDLEKLVKASSEDFYRKKAFVLNQFISDKVGMPAGGITSEIIQSRLVPMGLDEKTAKDLEKVFEKIDTARFGIGKDDPKSRKEGIDELVKVAALIEKIPVKRGDRR